MDATNQAVTYISSNPAVATVSTTGFVEAVALGDTTITITTDDGSFTATCQVKVTDKLIESETFNVNRVRQSFEGVPIGATAQEIIDSITSASGEIKVFDTNMQELTGDVFVSTGYYVQLIIGGEVMDNLQILILDDLNPDGILDIIDYTLIRLHILNLQTLEGCPLIVADVNEDGIIDIIDYTFVRLHILDVRPLYE